MGLILIPKQEMKDLLKILNILWWENSIYQQQKKKEKKRTPWNCIVKKMRIAKMNIQSVFLGEKQFNGLPLVTRQDLVDFIIDLCCPIVSADQKHPCSVCTGSRFDFVS